MRRLARLFAEHVAVGLMATMFASFLLQIAFRYVLNRPLGWTEEVTVICWVCLRFASMTIPEGKSIPFGWSDSSVTRMVRSASYVCSISRKSK